MVAVRLLFLAALIGGFQQRGAVDGAVFGAEPADQLQPLLLGQAQPAHGRQRTNQRPAGINTKRQSAVNKSIKFTCDVDFNNVKQPLAADEYDLSVIFGNILDNAIKAAEEAKNEQFVSVRTEAVKNYLVINVKNSTSNLPDRFDIQNFGTGLMNVRKIVEKGKGIMEIQTNSGYFDISILLPLA